MACHVDSDTAMVLGYVLLDMPWLLRCVALGVLGVSQGVTSHYHRFHCKGSHRSLA